MNPALTYIAKFNLVVIRGDSRSLNRKRYGATDDILVDCGVKALGRTTSNKV